MHVGSRGRLHAVRSCCLVAALAGVATLVPTAGALAQQGQAGPTGDLSVVGEVLAHGTYGAGSGCAFGVQRRPDEDARQSVTRFSDGRTMIVGHADSTFTNLESGAATTWASRFKLTSTYDSVANDFTFDISGRFFGVLFAGDTGPAGTVGDTGAILAFVGHAEGVFDRDTGTMTSFSLDGRATDVCGLLSGR